MSATNILPLPSPFTSHPFIKLNLNLDKNKNFVAERLIEYDLISFATKWNSLGTFMDTTLHNFIYAAYL